MTKGIDFYSMLGGEAGERKYVDKAFFFFLPPPLSPPFQILYLEEFKITP